MRDPSPVKGFWKTQTGSSITPFKHKQEVPLTQNNILIKPLTSNCSALFWKAEGGTYQRWGACHWFCSWERFWLFWWKWTSRRVRSLEEWKTSPPDDDVWTWRPQTQGDIFNPMIYPRLQRRVVMWLPVIQHAVVTPELLHEILTLHMMPCLYPTRSHTSAASP